MPPVVFAPEVAGKETALMVAMEEETKESYKREKASLIGFQGSFTKKEKAWGDAVDAWHVDPLSAIHKEAAEELRMAMKEAKVRLDAAIYGVISYGVVTDAYENFMDQMETRYQLINTEVYGIGSIIQRQSQGGGGPETADDKGGEGGGEEGKGREN